MIEETIKKRHVLSQRFHEILGGLGELHDKKGADYGADNDPFANVRGSTEWGVKPWVGAMIRATDKMKRLQKYARDGVLTNESAEDSFRDLAVYSAIALVLWEEEQQKIALALLETEEQKISNELAESNMLNNTDRGCGCSQKYITKRCECGQSIIVVYEYCADEKTGVAVRFHAGGEYVPWSFCYSVCPQCSKELVDEDLFFMD